MPAIMSGTSWSFANCWTKSLSAWLRNSGNMAPCMAHTALASRISNLSEITKYLANVTFVAFLSGEASFSEAGFSAPTEMFPEALVQERMSAHLWPYFISKREFLTAASCNCEMSAFLTT